jgi:hypothetical protein
MAYPNNTPQKKKERETYGFNYNKGKDSYASVEIERN